MKQTLEDLRLIRAQVCAALDTIYDLANLDPDLHRARRLLAHVPNLERYHQYLDRLVHTLQKRTPSVCQPKAPTRPVTDKPHGAC